MTAGRLGRRLAALGGLAGLLALAAAPGWAVSEEEERAEVFCDYVDAGDPGLSGNVLAVTVLGGERDSEGLNSLLAIRVGNADGRIKVRGAGGPIACEGARATVTTVDTLRIAAGSDQAVLLDLGGAPYAPGVTDEGDGSSEIEVSYAGEYGYLYIRGGSGPNRMVAAPVGAEGELGVNLNPHLDGRHDDADVRIGAESGVLLLGGPGADALANQGPDDAEESSRSAALALAYLVGGAGNDSLQQFAGPAIGGRGNDLLRGGSESAYLIGRGGSDTLLGAAGRDFIVGGNGDDELRGGSGRDRLLARDGRGERVDCGPGRDQLRSFDPGDGRRSCERRRHGERGEGLFLKAEEPAKRASVR